MLREWGSGGLQRMGDTMTEPNRRHPTGQHENTFKADAAKLRRLFAAGVPVIAVGMDRYRIEGRLPPGFRWDDEEDE